MRETGIGVYFWLTRSSDDDFETFLDALARYFVVFATAIRCSGHRWVGRLENTSDDEGFGLVEDDVDTKALLVDR